METKYKVILSIGIAVALFFAGRYTAPEKIKTETKIEKQIEVQKVVQTVTKIVEKPDGSKETTIVQNSETNTDISVQKDKTEEVTVKHDNYNISILGGVQPKLFSGISLGPIVYGASITKPIIGPITVGAWALSDYTVGVSVGFNF